MHANWTPDISTPHSNTAHNWMTLQQEKSRPSCLPYYPVFCYFCCSAKASCTALGKTGSNCWPWETCTVTLFKWWMLNIRTQYIYKLQQSDDRIDPEIVSCISLFESFFPLKDTTQRKMCKSLCFQRNAIDTRSVRFASETVRSMQISGTFPLLVGWIQYMTWNECALNQPINWQCWGW